MTRRDLLVGLGSMTLAPSLPKRDRDDMEFLRKLVLDTLEGSRVAPGTNGPKGWSIQNTCGFPLVTPGRLGYPAFWIRDFSMAADSGLMPSKEIQDHLFLIAKCQSEESPRQLHDRAFLPPYSIPDHINFDGKPVYYPGTYSSGSDQGGEPFGTKPPVDDHFEFIHIAFRLFQQTRNSAFLDEVINKMSLRDRLRKAYEYAGFPTSPTLIATSETSRAVGFGFCDSITITGELLYPSLLKYRAAKELYQMLVIHSYLTEADELATKIISTFERPRDSWLAASTSIGSQPDVWGTLLALHLRIFDTKRHQHYVKSVAEAYQKGTISIDAAVRHVPTDRDFSDKSAWEKALTPKGVYQNGAYWHTPTGWLIEALYQSDRKLGQQAFQEFMNHLRKGGDRPWECFNPTLNHYQNGGYLASVALPYSVLKTFTHP